MIVDAHHHVWDPSVRAYPWMTQDHRAIARRFTVDDLREQAPPEVRRTIAVQAVSSLDETRDLLRLAARSNLIAGVVGWVDLQSVHAADQIEALRREEGGEYLTGIRHQVQDEDDEHWLLRAGVKRGLKAVRDAGLAFDLLVSARELPAALEAAAALPDLRFVLDHGAKPDIRNAVWEPWSSLIEALAKRPNAACKLSGLVTEAGTEDGMGDRILPYARHILTSFGSARVMFGSDWPVCLLAASYRRVLELARSAIAVLTEQQQRAVLAENAVRMYRLRV